MLIIPIPIGYDTFEVEPFAEYRVSLPSVFNRVPDLVIETWIYRHWSDFRSWLKLNPLNWRYSLTSLSSEEILKISHVNDWPDTLRYWGDDLLDGNSRKTTWLGRYMLKHGTTPTPMIVAVGAGAIEHPRELGYTMKEPYQIIEGHMRLAYLQGLIRRHHPTIMEAHAVYLVEMPRKSKRGKAQS